MFSMIIPLKIINNIDSGFDTIIDTMNEIIDTSVPIKILSLLKRITSFVIFK